MQKLIIFFFLNINKYKKIYDPKFVSQVTKFNLKRTNSENHAMAFYVPDI